jgi:hypothetical protein
MMKNNLQSRKSNETMKRRLASGTQLVLYPMKTTFKYVAPSVQEKKEK